MKKAPGNASMWETTISRLLLERHMDQVSDTASEKKRNIEKNDPVD